MWVEAWIYKDSEDKKKKLDRKTKLYDNKKSVERDRNNKKLREYIKAEEALNKVKDMINDKDLELSLDQVQMIEKVISSDDISEEMVEEILEKIEEIEKTEDIDKYLSKEYRITKEEYKKAINNDVFRVQIITKLDSALTILANHVVWDASTWLNLFSWYIAMLDKKLIKIQDNHIDIKDNLEYVESKRNPKPELTFWQRLINFIKEIFS